MERPDTPSPPRWPCRTWLPLSLSVAVHALFLLVTMLIGQGVAGFPAISVARQTADSVELEPGCVELVVVSDIATDALWAGYRHLVLPHGLREMLLEHVDPEFGPYIGPGVVPKLTRTPGAVRWSASWEMGSHNDEVYGELVGLDEDERASLREAGVI